MARQDLFPPRLVGGSHRSSSLAWIACIALAMNLLSWVAWSPVAAQESAVAAPVKDSAADVITIPDNDLISIFEGARAPATLADLRRMEQRQKEVAAKVIPCTVGIRVGAAQGSGVLINADGFILTAAHVAQVPDQPAQIVLHDGRRLRGITLGMNRKIDAGLVKIEESAKDGQGWPFVEMGKSENVHPGQWCVATGHPGGYVRGRDPVFRVGRVLALDKTVIVTDCPLIGGDSGGPLFDMDGKVIGINSRIGPPLTANMHVPVSAYSKDWEAMAQGDIFGDVPRGNPYIGVQSEDAPDGGAMLSIVKKGKPAYESGLRDGDVVKKFDNRTIIDAQDLVKRVAACRVGQTIKLAIQRGAESKSIDLVIGSK